MRIDWSPPVQAAQQRRDLRAPPGERSNFADAIPEETQPAPQSAEAKPAVIDGLFALQEVADELSGRRRAAARGSALLDRLDELRLGLLTGTLPRTQLEALRQLAREHGPTADDPKLSAILSDIELRVAVELAKLDKFA
jgi:hypothetical protein